MKDKFKNKFLLKIFLSISFLRKINFRLKFSIGLSRKDYFDEGK